LGTLDVVQYGGLDRGELCLGFHLLKQCPREGCVSLRKLRVCRDGRPEQCFGLLGQLNSVGIEVVENLPHFLSSQQIEVIGHRIIGGRRRRLLA